MSKANYFTVKKLKEEFNKAMKNGNIELAREINAKLDAMGY